MAALSGASEGCPMHWSRSVCDNATARGTATGSQTAGGGSAGPLRRGADPNPPVSLETGPELDLLPSPETTEELNRPGSCAEVSISCSDRVTDDLIGVSSLT